MSQWAKHVPNKLTLFVLCYSAVAFSASGLGLVELQERAGISTGALGLVGAAALGAGLVGELLFSPFSDRGKVRLLAAMSAGSASAGMLSLASADSVVQIAGGKALLSVSLGIAVPLAMGEASRNTERRGRALAVTSGFQMTAHSIGAFGTAAALRSLGVGTTFAGIGVCGLLVTASALRTRQAPRELENRPPLFAFDLLRNPSLVGALLLATAFSLVTGVNGVLWDRLVTDTVATSGRDPNIVNGFTYVSWTLLYLAATMVGGRLADRVGHRPSRIAKHTYAPVAVVTVTYGLAFGPISIIAASALNGAVEGLLWPLVLVTIAAAAPENRSGAAQSLSHACISLCGLAAAGVTPSVYESAGAEVAYTATAGVTLLLGLAGAALVRGGRETVLESTT